MHHNPDVPTNQSEDCLNLNVFAPDYCSEPGGCSLPVLIWFHGGTFTEGWSEGPFDLYDGCSMSHSGGVVVVTANYRLGALGFLVTQSGSDGGYALKGNQGLRDQKAAMEWVRGNIAGFGGDPAMVTLFGQSAGSMSVGLHFISPEMFNSGLFKRVIMVRGAARWPPLPSGRWPLSQITCRQQTTRDVCRGRSPTTQGPTSTIWRRRRCSVAASARRSAAGTR